MSSEDHASEAERVAHQPTEAGIEGTTGMLGRTLDARYRIVRVLGEGGMGAVFVAEHLSLQKQVALKVIRAELAGNGEVAARFAREAMATAQFEHPHVASAIDYGTLPEGGAYFVMQLVRGRSLRSMFGGSGVNAKVPWRRACELCAQVADALSAAKAAGIIHRDLKPDNILVEQREDGSDLVKVLDFGIAHITPRDAGSVEGGTSNRQLTRVGTVMGTPGYMAPEQAVGDKVDHRADLYALGVVLWECIAGRELWDGPDLTTVIARQMGEPVAELRDVTGDATLPTELDELLQRLTSRMPDGRPEHAAEVRDTLRRLAVSGTVPGTSLPEVMSSLPQAVANLTPFVRTAITRFQQQPARTRGAQLVMVGALLATLMVLAMRGDEAQSTAGTDGASDAANTEAPQERSLFSKVTDTAKQLAAAAVPAPPKPEMPEALRDEATALIDADAARDRRSAAEAILAYRPEDAVLPHVRTIAELEVARSCKARKEVIGKMRKQADKRFLLPLERLSSMPRSGCGFLSLSDCYSCIRTDLRVAIATIQSRDGEAGKAESKAGGAGRGAERASEP